MRGVRKGNLRAQWVICFQRRGSAQGVCVAKGVESERSVRREKKVGVWPRAADGTVTSMTVTGVTLVTGVTGCDTRIILGLLIGMSWEREALV